MSKEAPAPLCEDRLDLIGNAPWWLISAGVHVALLLMATLICIERFEVIDDPVIVISTMPPPPPVVTEIIRPVDNEGARPSPIDDPSMTQDDAEVAIFFPEATEIGDHIETNDPDKPDLDGAFGASEAALAHLLDGGPTGLAGRGAGPENGIDTMGLGPGAGGRGKFGRPDRSGNVNMNTGNKGGRRPEEVTTQGALGWLARHQSPDGSWKAAGFVDQCHGDKCAGAGYSDYDTGVTGLALLAFLGAGYTHLSGEGTTADLRNPGKTIKYKDVVKKAIRWLVANQDVDGLVGPKVSKLMYNQAIAALALAEAYGMTESQILKDPAQKAIDYLTAAKNPYKAWDYMPANPSKVMRNDSSVTGWCVMALKSAKISGLKVSEAALHEANGWIKSVTDSSYGKVGYTDLESAGAQISVPGKNEQYENHEALGAVGMMTRIFVDVERGDPVLAQTATWLAGDLPVWDKSKGSNDYYYWYYGTLALFQFDGPDSGGSGKFWNPWNDAIKKVLPKNQHAKADGCAEGSWDADDRWAFEGGRVYAVAINALTMEVYQRYPNAFGMKDKGRKRE